MVICRHSVITAIIAVVGDSRAFRGRRRRRRLDSCYCRCLIHYHKIKALTRYACVVTPPVDSSESRSLARSSLVSKEARYLIAHSCVVIPTGCVRGLGCLRAVGFEARVFGERVLLLDLAYVYRVSCVQVQRLVHRHLGP